MVGGALDEGGEGRGGVGGEVAVEEALGEVCEVVGAEVTGEGEGLAPGV